MSSIIKQLGKLDKNLSKQEIEKTAIEDIKFIVEQDKYDLLKTLIELKRYNVYLNSLINKLKEPALKKALETGNKKLEIENAKVWVTKRVSFDYSNDKIWQKLKENTDNIKTQLKEHQELLKQLEDDIGQIIDEETGEIIELTPPRKKEENGLMIRI